MLQLNLNFLGRQLERFRPSQTRSPEPNKTLAWKHGLTVHLVRPPRARRYLLRLQSAGSVRLVIPRRGSRAEGLAFLERSEAWLLKQQARWQERSPSRQPWLDGARFLFRGNEVILRVDCSGGNPRLLFSDQIINLRETRADYRDPVLSHLRRLAERELPVRTRELAGLHNIKIGRVTVRAQKTRWGSCSARGTISLNWRLVLAPPQVVDYLIIHELMHRREMNHSKRYWTLVELAFPEYRLAEKWLKKVRLDRDYLAGADAAPAWPS
jgi:predicted metal-dependent hydrolase